MPALLVAQVGIETGFHAGVGRNADGKIIFENPPQGNVYVMSGAGLLYRGYPTSVEMLDAQTRTWSLAGRRGAGQLNVYCCVA